MTVAQPGLMKKNVRKRFYFPAGVWYNELVQLEEQNRLDGIAEISK